MKRLILSIALLLPAVLLFSQTKYRAVNSKITMEGTSTLHDWHMTSEQGISNVAFNFDGVTLTSMASLSFTVQVETFKSGTKGLNKNAYKALNSEQHPQIVFSSNYANIRPNGANTYVVSAKGLLTIAGTSKEVWVAVLCKVNPDMSIDVSGTHKLKMSDFKVTPPSFMFGAMKTGDELTIKINSTLQK